MLSKKTLQGADGRVLYDMQAAMTVAKQLKYCQRGDSVVAVHRIGHSAVIKISEVK